MKTFITELQEHQSMIERLVNCSSAIEVAASILIDTLQQGGKILLCGNGGSAADCQHIAAELVVRFEKNRKALAAIALTTDSSILTAHSNDIGFDTIYSRQIEAIGNPKDCLLAISTSGKSPNVINAITAAQTLGMQVIGLTGRDGGDFPKLLTHVVIVPSEVTARIQEAHILIGHWWCGAVERACGC